MASMSTTDTPQLPAPLAATLAGAGEVELGSFSQAELAVVGVGPRPPRQDGRRELLTGFERLPQHEQDQQLAAARAALEARGLLSSRGTMAETGIASAVSADPEAQALALVRGVAAAPLGAGGWLCTPAWHRPLDDSHQWELWGMALPDGSTGLLNAAVDGRASRVSLTVRTVARQAELLALDAFTDDDSSPDPATGGEGWNDQSVGALSMLNFTWPHGRQPRSAIWRINRYNRGQTTALLQARRNYGFRRSEDVEVDRAGLAERFRELLADATAEALGR